MLALIAAIAVNLYMAVKVGLGILNKHHKRKEDFFSAFEIQPNDVVFLGDSLTEGGRVSNVLFNIQYEMQKRSE